MKKFMVFLYLFLVSFPAYGQSTIIYETKNSVIEVEGRTIHIGGEISHIVANKILLLNSKKYKKISLHSWGGLVSAAIKIADYVHKNKLNTYVGKDKACHSACTIIYQAGEIRSAHKSAKFMYHYARRYEGKKYYISAIWTIRYVTELEKFGVPEDFVRQWRHDGGPLNLTAEETMRYNIVQNLIK